MAGWPWIAMVGSLLASGCALDWPPPVETNAPPADCVRCPAMAALVPAPATPKRSVAVFAGQDLQAVLDKAEAGDEIVLEAGATFRGSFTLPVTDGDAYLVVRTSAIDGLPGACTRIAAAPDPALPRLIGPAGKPALLAADGAHHVRVVGVELTVDPGSSPAEAIVMLGTGDETDVTMLPHDIELDRVIVRGPDNPSPNGIALHGGAATIKNSRVLGIVAAVPVSAITAYNGPGPYSLLNDELESYGAALAVGQSTSILGAVPSNISLAYSHLTRLPAWKKVGEPSYGTRWIELVRAAHVDIEANLMDQAWDGYDISLRTEDGGRVEDVSITNNTMRDGVDGPSLLSSDPTTIDGVLVRNNVLTRMDGRMMPVQGGGTNVAVRHNTSLQSGHIILADGTTTGFVFDDNIALFNAYGIWCDTIGGGTTCLEALFPGYEVRRNVIVGLAPGTTPSDYPPDNFFPAYDVGFVDEAGGDYRLAPNSPYRAKATDGKDVGVDFDELDAAAACRSP